MSGTPTNADLAAVVSSVNTLVGRMVSAEVRISALEAGTPQGPTVSPDGSTATAPGTTLIDASGNSIALYDQGSPRGLGVLVNGTLDSVTQQVILLLIWNTGQVYQDTASGWYVRSASGGWTWLDTDPRITNPGGGGGGGGGTTPPTSLDGTFATVPGIQLVDSAHNTFALTDTGGGNYGILVNGVLAPGIDNVQLILIYNSGQFYYEDSSGGVFTETMTPLRASATNARYLETQDGVCKWLAGPHIWIDAVPASPATMGWQDWIDLVVVPSIQHGPNAQGLVRMWLVDGNIWNGDYSSRTPDSMVPFNRSGTSGAFDGGNKWDLSSYNSTYFTTLHTMVAYCRDRGIHCQMLMLQGGDGTSNNSILSMFYLSQNNVNGSDFTNTSTYTQVPGNATCLTYQKAFVNHLVTVLYDLPNVTYEPANEVYPAGSATNAWTNAIIDQIHTTEIGLGGVKHATMTGAPAGWLVFGTNMPWEITQATYITPGWGANAPYNGYGDFGEPAVGGPNGNQPVLMDSDHTDPSQALADQVWRALTRGWGGFLGMDTGAGSPVATMTSPIWGGYFQNNDPSMRLGLLGTCKAANLLNTLNTMQPNGGLSSTGYCLADTTNHQFVVFQPNGGSAFTVNLSSQNGQVFNYYWLDATNGTNVNSGSYTATSSTAQSFTPASNGGMAALVLVKPTGGTTLGWHLRNTTSGVFSDVTEDPRTGVVNPPPPPPPGGLTTGTMFMGQGSPPWPSTQQFKDSAGLTNLPQICGIGGAYDGYNLATNDILGIPGLAPSTGISFSAHLLMTAGRAGSGLTPAVIVAGGLDAYYRAYVDTLAAAGYTRNAGYQGWIYARCNWEQNYHGTTPAGYASEQSGWGSQTGGWPYWFNTGGPSAAGGTAALAGADRGNFWAWQYLYRFLSWNSATSYAKSKGVPILIVWNPVANNANYWTNYNDGGIANYPINMYPGDDYCDVHGFDTYTNNLWPTSLGSFSGYYAQPAFTRNWPQGPQLSTEQWWSGTGGQAHPYDSLAHYFDYNDATDISYGRGDGLPTSGTDPTGANSNWGWGFYKFVTFALAIGPFAGARDPVTGAARVAKPISLPEVGIANIQDFGGGTWGRGPFDNPNGARPSYYPGNGGGEDLNWWPYIASRIAAARALGADFRYVIPWELPSGTVETQAMWSTFGASFPGI